MAFDPMSVLAQVQLYVQDTGVDDAAIQDALEAEGAAQAKRCRVPDIPSADLIEALCRRVARNLAMRKLPLGVQPLITDVAATGVYLGGLDPEVKRLEAPYRRWAVG